MNDIQEMKRRPSDAGLTSRGHEMPQLSIHEENIEFTSRGTVCRGLFVRPARAANDHRTAPLIVLAHGLGGIYEMRLDAYARRFAQAGYAALTFDYRYFGRSDGHPRHWLVRQAQQADIAAAIEYGKTLEGVDGQRIVLFGSSLAGGHMIDVTSERHDIAATIIQAPFTDGVASAMALSIPSAIGVGLFAAWDALSRLIRGRPVLVPLAGTFGTPAMMTASDVVQGVLKLFPQGSALSGRLSQHFHRFASKTIHLTPNIRTSDQPEPYPIAGLTGSVILPSGTVLINGVSAIFGLKIMFWRPGKKLKDLRTPMMVCVCDGDSVAPSRQTLRYAKHAPQCTVKVYPFGHFDIYTDEPFEVMTADQLAFLQRVVPVEP
ncbi:MAG: alpha/beta fold hydrolase [Aquabacterium sp.]